MEHDYIELDLSPVITSAKRAYIFYTPGSSILAERNLGLPVVNPPYDQIGKTFEHNLRSFLATVSIPATFAIASAQQSHWDRIYSAERIRSLKITNELEGKNENERQSIALQIATDRMNKFVASKEGQQAVAEDACRRLVEALEQTELQIASQELLRQGLVLLWGAFEVLSRDLFIVYLNSNPEKVATISMHPDTRAKFELKALKLEIISQYAFNLSTHMGNILENSNDLSDLATIRSIYKALFPSDALLRTALDDQNLWLLNHRRHLIVHQRGIIDSKYIENTGDAAKVGDILKASPNDLEKHLSVVANAGCQLLRVVA